jgi:tetratricopeptide (TPR) repeat protein
MVTVCLNMIVKNESRIIKRLLESVTPIIDTFCICDTGSTDNTVEIIQSYFASKNIVGTIVYEPFKNFEYNRNFALHACLGLSDFVLLLDADMVLDIRNFDKSSLVGCDGFQLFQGTEQFYYQNTRIVKNNGQFKYVGVTHEFISAPPNSTLLIIDKDQLFIIDYGDGGCKNDKYERDIRLLTDGIVADPKNDRYHFYLANSYHDAGHFEKAIPVYEKRIQLGGWNQEIWYSYYRIGLCYKKLGQIEKAISAWLEAFNVIPNRVENIYEIVHHYRVVSKHKLANIFYHIASKTAKSLAPREKDSFLFLHNDIYSYKLDYEYTIFSAYVGVKDINDHIVIVFNKCNNFQIEQNLLSNMKFYKHILIQTSRILLDDSRQIEVNGIPTKFNSSSSCIILNPSGNGYLLNIRYVNFVITERGEYLNCDKHIVTCNKYVEMDSHFKITREKWYQIEEIDRRYIGIEDVRIIHNRETDKLLFIGTGFHNDNSIGVVNGVYDVNQEFLVPTELKSSFSNTGCEKNWVYDDDGINIIYKWFPLQICKQYQNNTIEIIKETRMPYIFKNARGSTCGFKYTKRTKMFDDNISFNMDEFEIWFVVHLVSYESPRHYYHMLVVFDKSMNLLRYSAPFKFEGEPIEYCLGLVVEDEKVIMSYSTWDRTTRLGVYDKKNIDSVIKYNVF